MDIRAEIQTRVDEIEQIIKRYLPAEEGYQKTIMEAMNYSILAGGKRLRPMLMSETYRLFGGKSKVIEPFMAAMEMIHTYSLVHDDLPAMDNDEYRRGKKTTHAVYGEAMGILAGDALLNYAFETAAKAFDMEPDNRNIGKAMQILATKAGIYGMVGGQVVDVQSEVNSFGVIPKKEDWSYALLPVWTVTYKGKDGKIYYYSMNGQTGKVFGELPVDYGKVTLTGIISAVVVLIIALIGGYFL